MYNRLVESCFTKCVTVSSYKIFYHILKFNKYIKGFKTKQLDGKETECVTKCSEKFMKVTQRVGTRFAEYQAIKGQEGSK